MIGIDENDRRRCLCELPFLPRGWLSLARAEH